MDGIGTAIGGAIIFLCVCVALFVAFCVCVAGYFVSNSKYDKGYLKGQMDCQNGINKVIIKTDTTYQLK